MGGPRLPKGCAFFTAVHVVMCAYANFNPLDCARARAGLIVRRSERAPAAIIASSKIPCPWDSCS